MIPRGICVSICSAVIMMCWITPAKSQEKDEKKSVPLPMLGDGYLIPGKWTAGCGIDSLYLGLRLIGCDVNYMDLVRRAEIKEPGMWVSIGTLWQVTRESGAHSLALKLKVRDESDLKAALKEPGLRTAILHLKATADASDHLVCAYLTKNGKIAIAGGTTYQSQYVKTWEKRWSGVALVLSRTSLLGEKNNNCGGGWIHLDKYMYDAGKMPSGGHFTYSFKITNTGKAPLHIGKVFGDCGCNTFSLSNNDILPGKSADLTGKVEVGYGRGAVTKKVSLISDDVERPRVDLILKWELTPPFLRLLPDSLKFDPIAEGHSDSKFVKLEMEKNQSVSIKSIKVTEKWIQASLQPNSKQLKVSVTPKWTAGKENGDVIISLEGSDSTVKLPVHVNVVPAIVAHPTEVFLERHGNLEQVSGVVTLQSTQSEEPVRIHDMRVEGLVGKVVSEKNNQRNTSIKVSVGPYEEWPEYLKGYLWIKIENYTKEFRIPIYIVNK